ncbi:hypothetical protein FOS14_17385 [Skermania sp. ID1734]|uniref:hypothetical protein n=1 Tax=Skermania sp. ID1734 TaxID=2597516 RepID=UPI00117EF850|nr:hypothetical protein [Skermania sp. ID1734]TSD95585.1 hypothetical protein FOS14_17385 [Skermania sp. ID1734]
MADSLKARVREKLLRQLSEDGGRPVDLEETDDPRLLSVAADLAALDEAQDGDPVIEELASRYWVP